MRTIFLNCQLYAVEAGHISVEFFPNSFFCALLLFRNCTANIRYECLFLSFCSIHRSMFYIVWLHFKLPLSSFYLSRSLCSGAHCDGGSGFSLACTYSTHVCNHHMSPPSTLSSADPLGVYFPPFYSDDFSYSQHL